jgi:hypothetical protein
MLPVARFSRYPPVLSLNLARRHLNESQRAMVAARLATLPQGMRVDRSIAPKHEGGRPKKQGLKTGDSVSQVSRLIHLPHSPMRPPS